jgi:hypothetical protein
MESPRPKWAPDRLGVADGVLRDDQQEPSHGDSSQSRWALLGPHPQSRTSLDPHGSAVAATTVHSDNDTDDTGSCSQCSQCPSNSGDTIADSDVDDDPTAFAARQERRQPRASVEGRMDHDNGGHSRHNDHHEVGNFALFCGNWGDRGTLGDTAAKKARQATHDRQIMKCPGTVLVLLEASEGVTDLLRQPPAKGDGKGGVKGRDSFEHWVVRGSEPQTAVLIAARKDTCNGLKCIEYNPHIDHNYRANGKNKRAITRSLVCEVSFKQNIGHLGKSIMVCGVHGNFMTMKCKWPDVLREFWDRLANNINKFGINFLAGDFNMSLTEVVKQLKTRGITCDCIAWYPWVHAAEPLHEQPLGFDSCGIFYIGGRVQVRLDWSLDHIDVLTAVAEEMPVEVAVHPEFDPDTMQMRKTLDTYRGSNHPGQPWHCYRSKSFNEVPADKNLRDRLYDLLRPSTAAHVLADIPQQEGGHCPYLRVRQKTLDVLEWLVNGQVHNGAHFPLCVWTNNSSARSAQASRARSERSRAKGWTGSDVGWGSTQPQSWW